VTPKQREAQRRSLERLRAELCAAGPQKIEPNRKDPTTVGVADEDEQALSEMLQTLASQRNRQAAARIAQIDRALRKLTSAPDEYGLCESCEEEIAGRRLELLPDATLCAECQGKEDPKRGGSRKGLTDFR
jgi:DnaK suppressor protein